MENTYRDVNIALANEFARVATTSGSTSTRRSLSRTTTRGSVF